MWVHDEDRPGMLDSAIFWLLSAILLFGVLAFGAVEYWSIFVMRAGSMLLVLLFAIRLFAHDRPNISFSPGLYPLFALLLLTAIQSAFGLTALPYTTAHQLLNWIMYVSLALIAVQVLNSASRLLLWMRLLAFSGFAIALFGTLQHFTSQGKLYWVRVPRFGGTIFGPYVNHNHYAGLMEMLTPVPLVLSFNRDLPMPMRLIYAFFGSFMAISVFLSGSRGGMIAVSVEFVVLLAFMVSSFRRHKNGALILLAGVVFFAIVGLTSINQAAVQRIETIRQIGEPDLSAVRMAILHDSWSMVKKAPVLGWGAGTFASVYPPFRSFYDPRIVNEAHDDYLQFLVENGSLGLIAFLSFFAVAGFVGVPVARNWEFSIRSMFTLAMILGCTGIAVHSFTDFNLQVPANASLFYIEGVMAAAFHVAREHAERTPFPISLRKQ